MLMGQNRVNRSDYLIRSVYRDLIRKHAAENKDTTVLRDRLTELEEEKWGNTVEGVPTVRRVPIKPS
jgi:hypothetical protein|tara:strand:+ start:229 stop:429 length:201 start_codon:yes stop_codon:yes gene_type:complete